MIKHIGNSLGNFPGPAHQTRCFVHTVNLIAKSILKPFDTQKLKDIKVFEDAMAEVHEQVNKDIDEEEDEEGESDEDEDNDDNELEPRLEPIRTMLLKVCLPPQTLILVADK
jgi:hypothetical protein